MLIPVLGIFFCICLTKSGIKNHKDNLILNYSCVMHQQILYKQIIVIKSSGCGSYFTKNIETIVANDNMSEIIFIVCFSFKLVKILIEQ